MAKPKASDILLVLRGLGAVSRAASNITEVELKEAWMSSSVRTELSTVKPRVISQELSHQLGEVAGKSLAVAKGVQEFSIFALHQFVPANFKPLVSKTLDTNDFEEELVDPSTIEGNTQYNI